MRLRTDFYRLKRNVNKIKNGYFAEASYLDYYEKLEIKENTILLEAQHGEGVNGNIYYLLKELCENPKYEKFELYLSVTGETERKIKSSLDEKWNQRVNFVRIKSRQYYMLMASVKYLINDTTFLPFYIKKDGQVYLNTWHGTPLKTLGKKVNNDFHGIGNVQKNFVVADYLLYPNEYTMEHMLEDYMINELTDAKTVLSGYPRNSIFLNKDYAKSLKRTLGLGKKEVFAYMPTWRGAVGREEREKQISEIEGYLEEIDKRLLDNQVFYVNLHPFVKNDINLKKFKKIKSFPKQYETYEFLNVCDCLITDYSSVFYDFAITRKKIILFTYDKEEYFAERGVYMSLDELPFTQTNTVEELVCAMNKDKAYDEQAFLETYCAYDSLDASEKLLDLLLFNKEENIKVEKITRNGKENVLMFVGNLAKNGITSSLMSLLKHVDLEKRNYFLTFATRPVSKHKETILDLPEGVNYIPTMGVTNARLKEKKILKNYRKDKIKAKQAVPYLEKMYDFEKKRCYGNAKFTNVVHFTGYEFKKQLLYSRFVESNRIIYVHSNMEKEIEVRKNQHPATLKYAYNHYDKVAIVTQDMLEPTMTFCQDRTKISVANNLFDYETVIEKAQKDLMFDEDTVCNIEFEDLQCILKSDATKFVSVGRFSPEKGHERLIAAFNRFWEENPSSYLIIIGGHGVEYEKTVAYAQSLPAAEHIILIKSMTNPFALVKQCNCFVLSSFYEALGLVILEADVLGIPAFSTNILGPSGFMKKYNGNLVDNSEEGIYNGMIAFKEGKLKTMSVDYEKYNEMAVQEFENLLR